MKSGTAPLRLLFSFTVAALIFAGCGSSDETAPTTTTATTAAPTTEAPTTPTTTTATPTTAAPTTTAPPATVAPSPEPERRDILDVTAGVRHACLLYEGGEVWCWGENENGQLGDGEFGSNVYSTVPVRVQDITDAVAIGAGWEHTCAVHATGEVSCWGDDSHGELGNGEESDFQPLPVKVVDIDDAVDVTAGHWHTCALRENGSISCWGADHDGQLGAGEASDEDDSVVPVEVTGISDAVAVSAGGEHTCAVHATGEVSCWGDNWKGELGTGQIGDEFDSEVPVKVSGIDDAVGVSSGDWHTCAVRESGTVSCWGDGQDTNLVGVSVPTAVPVDVSNLNDATAVSAGTAFSCAVRGGGRVSCWGDNGYGQLGSPPTVFASPTPVEVPNIDDAKALAAGSGHSCVIRESGGVACWGANYHGQLGHGQDSGVSRKKVQVAGIDNAVDVSAAFRHTCATHATGEVSCWGGQWKGDALSAADGSASTLPVKVQGIETAIGVSSGIGLSCATLEGNEASCWGQYWTNNLVTTDNGDTSPVSLKWQDTEDIIRIETGGSHACALHDDGTITCAGANWYGNVGNGEFGTSISWTPSKVVGIDDAVDVSLGFAHTCAVHATGEVSCWGRNDDGQLGNGMKNDANSSAVPVKVLGITDAVSISSGANSLNCVLHATGEVSCWGSNYLGELGTHVDTGGTHSSADHSPVPVKIEGIANAAAVSAGNNHACVLQESGEVSCWGHNGFGELGTGGHLADDQTATPQKVEGVTDATAVSAGFAHTCALRESGEITCWGWDENGQLGDGEAFDNTNSYTPVKVFDS